MHSLTIPFKVQDLTHFLNTFPFFAATLFGMLTRIVLQIQAGADDQTPARFPWHLGPQSFLPCSSILGRLKVAS